MASTETAAKTAAVVRCQRSIRSTADVHQRQGNTEHCELRQDRLQLRQRKIE